MKVFYFRFWVSSVTVAQTGTIAQVTQELQARTSESSHLFYGMRVRSEVYLTAQSSFKSICLFMTTPQWFTHTPIPPYTYLPATYKYFTHNQARKVRPFTVISLCEMQAAGAQWSQAQNPRWKFDSIPSLTGGCFLLCLPVPLPSQRCSAAYCTQHSTSQGLQEKQRLRVSGTSTGADLCVYSSGHLQPQLRGCTLCPVRNGTTFKTTVFVNTKKPEDT